MSEENLNKTSEYIHEIRLSCPNKTIWLYTGFDFDLLREKYTEYQYTPFANEADQWLIRWQILENVDVLIDGKYIDSQRDITLKYRGSTNQRVIDIQKSLEQNKVVLYCD